MTSILENEPFPIGILRRMLFVEGRNLWNAYVRDKTAEMELEWARRFQPSSEKKEEFHYHCTIRLSDKQHISGPGCSSLPSPTLEEDDCCRKCNDGAHWKCRPCVCDKPAAPFDPCKCGTCIECIAMKPAASGKCGCIGIGCDDPAKCKCPIHAPDPAIEAKIDAIVELLINNRCDKRSSLAKELRELVELARRSDR